MKVLIIEFWRHNPWGTTDNATMYFVDGKRISRNRYMRGYSSFVLSERGYVHDFTKTWSTRKDGIDRDYTEIHYKTTR